jgi:hypothetical protein
MDRRLDPAHDRVRLTAEERATWASLERMLADEPDEPEAPGESEVPGESEAPGVVDDEPDQPGELSRRPGRSRRRLRRVVPWLVALLVVALPLAASASAEAGVVCGILLTVALTTWVASSFDRLRVFLRLRPPPTDHGCS